MEVSDSLSEVGSTNVHISQVTPMILRIKDTLGKHCPRETFVTAAKKFFIPNESFHFNMLSRCRLLEQSYKLICSFKIT